MLYGKKKIGIGILFVVLITTAIMVPVSIFLDRAIREDESEYPNSIKTWGYDDQISSTAEKMNDYMGITKTSTVNIYGGQNVLSGEPSLLKNSNYHTVQEDYLILEGVSESENGLGYLTTSWVKTGSNLTPLMAEIGDDMLDPTNDSDKEQYAKSGMHSTLNIHMKVPVEVANSIKINKLGATVNTSIAKDYYSKINKLGFADDFAVQLGFFNYLATSTEAKDYAADAVLSGTTTSTDEFNINDLNAMEKVYKDITGTNNSLLAAVKNQEKETGNHYSIKIDGTGTNTGLIKAQVQNFKISVNKLLPQDQQVNFYYDLVNGGSGEAWKVSLADNGPEGSDARQDAFLGTQSRFSEKYEFEKWGYNESAYLSTNDRVKYNDPVLKTKGQVIGLTAGIDLTTFFIKQDMTFEFEIKTLEAAKAIDPNAKTNQSGHNIESFTIKDKNYKYGETIKVHPTGFTSEGARQAYEFGNNWSNLISTGLITAEIF